MKLTLYGYPKCSTCRQAVKWLKGKGLVADEVDIFQTPPPIEVIRRLVGHSSLDIRKFFNTSGEAYRELELKDKLPAMSDEEKLGLLAGNGRLIKRPVVTDGVRVTVGFKEEEYERVWGS